MTTQVRKNVMDMFIDGARRGFTIATTNLLPNVVMAFVIIVTEITLKNDLKQNSPESASAQPPNFASWIAFLRSYLKKDGNI
ncbi:hypothetical protein E2K75_13830, partial [Escherichia coli]